MATILSIQSHVAYGYVGNRAAVFPLQRMGHEVLQVNTVQFSNHTGYGYWLGDVFTPEHVLDVLAGLTPYYASIDAILTGYLGDPLLGSVVLSAVTKIREANPNVLYVCDPVMGDVGCGMFVNEALPPLFSTRFTRSADVLTPNLFELAYLTDTTIKELANPEALEFACKLLHGRGVKTILVTSAHLADMPKTEIGLYASSHTGENIFIRTPFYPFEIAPNGAGDLASALFCAHLLQKIPLLEAAQKTAAALETVFKETHTLKRRELALIQAQHAFI